MDGLDNVLRQRYELKITGWLGMDNDGSQSEVFFLNRVLRMVHSENRPRCEGHLRYAVIIELGLTSETTKTVDTRENREERKLVQEAHCFSHR